MLSGSLFGCLLAVAGVSSSAVAQTTAPNEWTWMGGSSTRSVPAVYGTLGTAAPANIPGKRYQAASWTDKSGNLWLFGGNGYDANGNNGWLNDLWEYQTSTNEWAWMGGSSMMIGVSNGDWGQPGVYGTQGTPSAGNIPGGRSGAIVTTDSSGHVWLLGGGGFDANGSGGNLNDLWEFNPSTNEWTWVSGSDTVGTTDGQPGIYGTLGTAAAGNVPGGRGGSTMWAGKNGLLWLFGGVGVDANGNEADFNDFWEFNPTNSEWTWMGGITTTCPYEVPSGVWGTLETPAQGNIPSCRLGANGWTDSSGNLWLFGGQGRDIQGNWGDHNDLWEFNPSTNEWAWMGGSSTIGLPGGDQPGVYGTLGTPAAGNIPASRWAATNWTDLSGNFWLFGGVETGYNGNNIAPILNDLWEFNPTANKWSWMGGSTPSPTGFGPDGVYGTLGVPAAGDDPGSRYAANGWTDGNGNFWLFGGFYFGAGIPGDGVEANDLWEYQPSNGPLPTTATPTFSLPAGSYSVVLSVTISDTTNGSTIYYTTDGTAPTTSSAVYSGPIGISSTTTLQAIAAASGCLTSAVTTAVYTLPPQIATPTFSVPAGTYTTPQTVAISEATGGAIIRYTINGDAPTSSSPVYGGPIAFSSTTTIEAIATEIGELTSNVETAVYTINLPQVATPVLSLASGNYTPPQTVKLSDTTAGATIYYTTNGEIPTANSTVYSGPLTLTATTTLQAVAMLKNYDNSAVASAAYIMVSFQAATPTFSLAHGTYSAIQSVTLADATSGAAIYYTTDGKTTPTTSSTPYSGAISVVSTETIQAIAAASGYGDSQVASATYTIDLPTPDFAVAASPSSFTVTGGQSGSTAVSVTPENGFSAAVLFSCSGLPSGASCSFSPGSVTPSGGVASTTVTVATSSVIAALERDARGLLPGAALAIAFGFFGWKKRRLQLLLLVIPSVLALGLLNGCGGGVSGGGAAPIQPVTSTVTVTATSGSLQHSTTFSMTVN
jgi:N-acetylneuraminic acid mutarotase